MTSYTSGVGVAQLAEHWIVAPVVVGSNPIAHPPEIKGLQRFSFSDFLLCPVGVRFFYLTGSFLPATSLPALVPCDVRPSQAILLDDPTV
jgi:hypothetical protein